MMQSYYVNNCLGWKFLLGIVPILNRWFKTGRLEMTVDGLLPFYSYTFLLFSHLAIRRETAVENIKIKML